MVEYFTLKEIIDYSAFQSLLRIGIYLYISLYACVCEYMCIYMCTCIYMHACALAYRHTEHVYICIDVCIHTLLVYILGPSVVSSSLQLHGL